MLDNTQQKGTLTELHCIMDLTNLGIRCLKPVDESSKYDIVADLNGNFIRIQCKTASWDKPTGDLCPNCNNLLTETKNGIKCANCDYTK